MMFTSPTNPPRNVTRGVRRVRPVVKPVQRSPLASRDSACDGHRLFLIVGDDDERDPNTLLDVHQFELGLLAQLLIERGSGSSRSTVSGVWRGRARATRWR